MNNDVEIPVGSWFTMIGGWYRVRIKTKSDPHKEIGCGNSQEQAAKEAWEWWEDYVKLHEKLNR